MLLKYGENRVRRLAGLELRREWIGKQVVFYALFVDLQGAVKDKLKVVRRGARIV